MPAATGDEPESAKTTGSGDDDGHPLGLDHDEDAEEAYDERLVRGWKLVAVGIITAPASFAYLQGAGPTVSAFALLLVAPLSLGPIYVGSAMIQFPEQTVGRFDTWSKHDDSVKSPAGGAMRGVLFASVGLAVGLYGITVFL
ncbi:hypothetical protein [Haloarchaeobius sp. HME9146]|uniref:hypothetical protein n=1 Tax=Haloarchaeobius sp. HME9146 TaxID=2978732 RepID=UPI0021BEBC18|nr:hypothetical protein [Haloarchaeobius sp. HME9146]MCT9095948.1 hypothetical protein [Haloarchaeobius sp. HME9146]